VKDVVATLRQGWFFEGQWSKHHDGPRGTPAGDLPPRVFVHCIQNHDQVGNRALGDRLHHVIPDAVYRAVSAVLLLAPYTPLLWMGQEWAASTPFRFFTDFPGDLGRLVTTNRRREFGAFAAFRDPLKQQTIPDPQAESTFIESQLHWDERVRHPHDQTLALYTELLKLRRTSAAFRSSDRGSFHVEQLSDNAFAMRRESDIESALALFQFADGVHWLPADHELLALAPGRQWQVALSTDEARFGGSARSNGLTESGCVEITGIGALVLKTSRTSALVSSHGGEAG
jgi:maltooligosyltrehalose trehalohydrolase